MGQATKEQQARDLRISRPTKKSTVKKSSNFAASFTLVVKEYAMTVLVLLYILSAVIGGASWLGLVNAPKQLLQIVASLLIAYAAVAFVQFVNRGVKQQIAASKSTKED